MFSGKTTAARHISNLYGHRVCSFATPVKQIARDVFGADPNDKARNRELLQSIGMKLREIDEDVFAKACVRSIDAHGRVAVDDLRFPNEEAYLRKAGFTMILVIRPNAPKGAGADHVSETSIDLIKPDFTIVNDGTLKQYLDLVGFLVYNPPPRRGYVFYASRSLVL